MTLNQIKAANKDFGANHTVKVNGFKDGNGGPKKPRNTKPPKYFTDFVEEQRQFNQQVLKFMNYVLDVFKRNNLK